MSWKTYIENQALQGRITPEWKALIVTTADQAVEEYKVELMKAINILLDESKSKRDTINDECINPYFARLNTLEEIIKLVNQ